MTTIKVLLRFVLIGVTVWLLFFVNFFFGLALGLWLWLVNPAINDYKDEPFFDEMVDNAEYRKQILKDKIKQCFSR